MPETILSLCDYSGRWAKPWADAGRPVLLVDPKHPSGLTQRDDGMHTFGGTVADALQEIRSGGWDGFGGFDVILAAPPCQHLTIAGAQYWPAKDADGRTAEATAIVYDIMEIVSMCDPRVFALENPVGRIESLVPELQGMMGLRFNPCDYVGHADDPSSEAYTKRTCLWGWFSAALPPAPVEPVFITASNGDRYAPMFWKTGGKSARTKEIRSNTPMGFARAFYAANHNFHPYPLFK